jgi:hypothetical protein
LLLAVVDDSRCRIYGARVRPGCRRAAAGMILRASSALQTACQGVRAAFYGVAPHDRRPRCEPRGPEGPCNCRGDVGRTCR